MVLHICTTFVFVIVLHLGSSEACGFSGSLEVGQSYTFTSPNYPREYPGGVSCRWTVDTPENSTVDLYCPAFDIGEHDSRCVDTFKVSTSGDMSSGDNMIYCGKGNLAIKTTTNYFGADFSTNGAVNRMAKGFSCVLTVLAKPRPMTTPVKSRMDNKKKNVKKAQMKNEPLMKRSQALEPKRAYLKNLSEESSSKRVKRQFFGPRTCYGERFGGMSDCSCRGHVYTCLLSC